VQFRVGTSGYSYAEWNGSFHPEQLPAVEINNTFYRLPKASVLEAWAERLLRTGWDEAFVFFKHEPEPGAGEEEGAGPRRAREFLDLAERVASRKGPIAVRPVVEREAG